MKEYLKWWILTRSAILASILVFPPSGNYVVETWLCLLAMVATPIIGDVIVCATIMAVVATFIMGLF